MTPRPVFRHLAVLLLGAALSSCSGLKEQFGLTKSPPDEFTVVTKAPLIIPPDLTLRPPRPGASGPQDVQVREQARRALLRAGRDRSGAGDAGAAGDRSRGETALLSRAGADKADPDIRTVIRRETSALAEEDESFTRRLMFWQDEAEEESVVDAEKEAERLREAAAEGKSPAEGEVPTIERKDTIFKRMF